MTKKNKSAPDKNSAAGIPIVKDGKLYCPSCGAKVVTGHKGYVREPDLMCSKCSWHYNYTIHGLAELQALNGCFE